MFGGLKIGLAVALVLAIAPIISIVGAYVFGTKQHPSQVTVMITNFKQTSGGTGVVIKHTPTKSLILTNAHVCGLVSEKGGLVKQTDNHTYFVTGTMTSKNHDLCVISVAEDLGTSVKIASEPPELYSEATITGHPALLPNIISKGHFGGRQVISIITGVKPCTQDDFNGQNALLCMFLGGLPIVKMFDSQVVSATIQGGSSGSAVLNSNGELSGLVFAGAGNGLSYASIVPYEYVIEFLYGEFSEAGLVKPPAEFVASADKQEEINLPKQITGDIIRKCKTSDIKNPKIKSICKLLLNDSAYREEDSNGNK
jgi:S1-C subfamily serine protease